MLDRLGNGFDLESVGAEFLQTPAHVRKFLQRGADPGELRRRKAHGFGNEQLLGRACRFLQPFEHDTLERGLGIDGDDAGIGFDQEKAAVGERENAELPPGRGSGLVGFERKVDLHRNAWRRRLRVFEYCIRGGDGGRFLRSGGRD